MNQVLGPIKLSAGPVAASATRIGARFEAGMIGLGLAGGCGCLCRLLPGVTPAAAPRVPGNRESTGGWVWPGLVWPDGSRIRGDLHSPRKGFLLVFVP